MAAAQAARALRQIAGRLSIPAGTRVPLALKQAISTKNAREGDAVYAVTTFPVVINERMVIPSWNLCTGTDQQC